MGGLSLRISVKKLHPPEADIVGRRLNGADQARPINGQRTQAVSGIGTNARTGLTLGNA
jgi:hypothetical protein